MNVQLQKQGQLVHELYGHVKAVQNKLQLWENQMRNGNAYHFKTLSSFDVEDFTSFSKELKSLSAEFSSRFADFYCQEIAINIFSSPFDTDVEKAPFCLQMELIELQQNSDLKVKFREVGLSIFFQKYFESEKYPNLAQFIRKLFAQFGSTYCCEQFFSKMNLAKSKTRTRIADSHLETALRVATSSIPQNLDRLVKDTQAQASH